MSGTDDYESAMPVVKENLAKFEAALACVRESHRGQDIDAVRNALVERFTADQLEVWSEVLEDAARLISEPRSTDACGWAA